ncbi:uncharacterized protein LOC129725478 [Wyeomyia smithii]|uniref:uncharacterized protein LOC129725478 n=1 Tax=Wyeomyia smithii TaxID=174621 RepID=UPI002467CCE6|nr:uncharacterized protein LOC129725478 [Wyeomyia smithii]
MMQSIIMLMKIFLLVLAIKVSAAFLTCTGGYESGCKDCMTQLQCMGSHASIQTVCPVSAPYCASGSCSTSLDVEAGCKVASIRCTGIGKFPDPSTCQAYHFCDEAEISSDVYTCPPGNIFNGTALQCERSPLAEDCVTLKCPASTGVATYGTSKTYYAICVYSNNVLSQILMMKCPDGATFDGKNCIYQCKEEGSFADSNDPSKYYQCQALNGGWTYYHLDCPTGEQFDASQQKCVSCTCTC